MSGNATIERLARNVRYSELMLQFKALGKRPVYGGLAAYATARGLDDDWICAAFREIFGAVPRDRERHPALELDGYIVDEWQGLRFSATPVGFVRLPLGQVNASD